MAGEGMPVDPAALAGGHILGEKIELPEAAQVLVELQAKLRCEECSERIRAGWTYTYITTTMEGGQAIAMVQSVVLCDREKCEGRRKAVEEAHAICRERMEIEWLDDADEDAMRKSLEDRARAAVGRPSG